MDKEHSEPTLPATPDSIKRSLPPPPPERLSWMQRVGWWGIVTAGVSFVAGTVVTQIAVVAQAWLAKVHLSIPIALVAGFIFMVIQFGLSTAIRAKMKMLGLV